MVAVLVSQEVFVRRHLIHSPGWTNFLSFCVALTVAAIYELIEWVAVVLGPELTDNFLGMQGFIWDAQSDMFFALLGALSILPFSKRLRRAIGPLSI
jgi:putative membrane protein